MVNTLRLAAFAFLAALFLVVCPPARAGGAVDVMPNVTLWMACSQGQCGKWSLTQDIPHASMMGPIRQAIHSDTGTGFCLVTRTVSQTAIGFRVDYGYTGGPPGGSGCGDPPPAAEYGMAMMSKVDNTCPDNAVGEPYDSPKACTCMPGWKPDALHLSCIVDCTANATASSGYYDIGATAGATPTIIACAGQCEAIFDGVSPAGSSMVNGEKHWFARGSYIVTGNKCKSADTKQVGTSTGTADLPKGTCAAGQGSASMNGKSICVDQSGNPTDASKNQASSDAQKTKVTNPDGSVTETEVRTRVDANGNKETTTTTTTTRPDGSSTTSRRVDNPLPGSILGGAGSGNSGTGTGNSNDNNPEKGPCEKNPSSAGCGGEAAPVGDLYTAKDKTLSSVLSAASNQFSTSPFGQAAGSFFAVSNAGSCPTWSASVSYLKTTLTIDQFCTPFATQALYVLKMALLLAASFFAFRVAVE